MWKMNVCCLYRDELRLHPGVSSQHRDMASHQAHVDHRPLQNSLCCPAYCQLPTVPPSAQSGHVPDQTLTPLLHMVLSGCFRSKLKDFLNTKISYWFGVKDSGVETPDSFPVWLDGTSKHIFNIMGFMAFLNNYFFPLIQKGFCFLVLIDLFFL